MSGQIPGEILDAIPASAERAEPVLQVSRVEKAFGGFRAVRALSFEVWPGELMGLVGPNGAGKTTTLNLISGFLKADGGSVHFRGQEITRWSAARRAREGLVRTFQNTTLFSRLTVRENVLIGCHTLTSYRRAQERAAEVMGLVGIEGDAGRLAGELPYGIQRLLEIAIAVAGHPRLLLLDEPLAGMNPTEAQECMRLIHGLRESGVTVVLVEHNMRAVMEHCGRVVVMHHGTKLAEGTPAEIQRDPEVIDAYLGRGHRKGAAHHG